MNKTNSVTFLGVTYNVPTSLADYDAAARYFAEAENRTGLKFGVRASGPDFIDKVKSAMAIVFESEAEGVVKLYCSHHIYNKSAKSLMESNPGYNLFNEATDLAQKQVIQSIGMEAQEYLQQAATAQNQALSNVRGYGTVFMSDPVEYGLFSALNYSKQKQQLQKANVNYTQQLNFIEESAKSRSNSREQQIYINNYFPAAKAAISLFFSSMFATYIADLVTSGELTEEVMNFTKYDDSESIINNLVHISDETEIKSALRDAFIACPLNANVYFATARAGLLSTEECEAAKVEGINDILCNYCKTMVSDASRTQNEADYKKSLRQFITATAVQHGRSFDDELSDYMNIAKSKLDVIFPKLETLEKGNPCDESQFLISIMGKDIVKGHLEGDNQINSTILARELERYLTENIPVMELLYLVEECGYTPNPGATGSLGTTLTDYRNIIKTWTDKLNVILINTLEQERRDWQTLKVYRTTLFSGINSDIFVLKFDIAKLDKLLDTDNRHSKRFNELNSKINLLEKRASGQQYANAVDAFIKKYGWQDYCDSPYDIQVREEINLMALSDCKKMIAAETASYNKKIKVAKIWLLSVACIMALIIVLSVISNRIV